MDELGRRLIRDSDAVSQLRRHAARLEREARDLHREADEIERLAELARLSRTPT